jgi:hypothetical protein
VAKDLRLSRLALLVIIVLQIAVLLVGPPLFPGLNGSGALIYLVVVIVGGVAAVLYRLLAVDSGTRGLLFLKALPITKAQIYGAKWLVLGLFILIDLPLLYLVFWLLGAV